MKLLVGLGNPGEKYKDTRHNVGFGVLDQLSTKFEIRNSKQKIKFEKNRRLEAEIAKLGGLVLAKPQTFMNLSGKVVGKIIRFYKIDMADLWVVHDDLDIELGKFKIQHGRGPKVHNGVNSVETSLGTDQFWRVRVGIEHRSKVNRQEQPGEDYVLKPFLGEERKVVERVIDVVVEELNARLV